MPSAENLNVVFSEDLNKRRLEVAEYYGLSDEEADLLPTGDDVQSYRNLGYYKSKPIFSDAEINNLVIAQDRFYNEESKRFQTHNADGMMKTDYARQEITELDSFIRKQLFAANGAMLCGEPIRLWHDQLLCKNPSRNGKKANVGWHTDAHYWQSNRAAHFGHNGAQMLTGWVPLHDVGVREGSLIVIPKSHLSDLRKIDDTLDFFSKDAKQQEQDLKDRGVPFDKHTMILKKGEVSFHHVNTIHGSGDNQSEQPRRSVAIHLQPLSGRYDPLIDFTGELAVHPMMKLGIRHDENGKPDFSDPVFCPQLGVSKK